MMLLAGATSLMVIFLAIELLSLALYVLSGFSRHEERSQEAALKYLLLGGFASGFLLFGMALIYGETGHTQLAQIAAAIQSQTTITVDPLLLAGVLLLFIGFAFKVSAAPFHSWTPDVYQGAPTSVTTFMSVTTKVAAFAALVRVFTYTFDGGGTALLPALGAGGRAGGDHLDGRRQRRRADPDERQAHARLLGHRPGRVHPHRRGRRAGAAALGTVELLRDHRGAVLPGRLRGHQHRRLRGHHHHGRARRGPRQLRRVCAVSRIADRSSPRAWRSSSSRSAASRRRRASSASSSSSPRRSTPARCRSRSGASRPARCRRSTTSGSVCSCTSDRRAGAEEYRWSRTGFAGSAVLVATTAGTLILGVLIVLVYTAATRIAEGADRVNDELLKRIRRDGRPDGHHRRRGESRGPGVARARRHCLQRARRADQRHQQRARKPRRHTRTRRDHPQRPPSRRHRRRRGRAHGACRGRRDGCPRPVIGGRGQAGGRRPGRGDGIGPCRHAGGSRRGATALTVGCRGGALHG